MSREAAYNETSGSIVVLYQALDMATHIFIRVNFRFAPCGLIVLTVLPQTFKNSHFIP
ncbi:hypothetical protein Hanom_Chr14g01325291 [Helianthus anomalus]